MSRKPQAARTAGPVGRDDVLAELRRVVDEAVGGRGHLLLLAGEAGIGKTTMLTAAAGFAESRGIRVGWGWGWPGEGAPGYWPWVQVMRMLGLDIPWPAEDRGQPVRDAPASERFRLFDEVTSLLLAESRIQPLLLLLDDLQWADQPSQLLLDFLARRLPAGAVAVVGGYRDTEPAPGPVLAALAARTTVLPLTGLGPDAVGDLVADVVGEQRAAEVAAGVHRRTGGNPFFVQQVSWLLHGGQEGIPPRRARGPGTAVRRPARRRGRRAADGRRHRPAVLRGPGRPGVRPAVRSRGRGARRGRPGPGGQPGRHRRLPLRARPVPRVRLRPAARGRTGQPAPADRPDPRGQPGGWR